MQYDITNPEDLMLLAHKDPKYIIESGFVVINKDKEPVPFIFNRLQNEYYSKMSIRDDILKASQLGFSTMILAILTVKFLLVPNAWCVCISHDDISTQKLLKRVKYFLDNLPWWLKPFLELNKDNKRELENKKMNSYFYIGTANSRSFGRGDTVHYAHFSEISRWRNAAEVYTNIIRAVPNNNPDTWVVKETTANGQGNFHHQEWKKEMDGESAFQPLFMPWFKHEEYTVDGANLHGNYTDDERELLRKFPEYIDDGRLQWRRDMISQFASNAQGYDATDMFKQEFPSTWQEAFLFSGNPFFPTKELQIMKSSSKPPIATGNLFGVSPNDKFDETPKGWIQLYELPEFDGQYEIGADTASGNGKDWSVATVVDKKTWQVVAKFRAKINAGKFGDELNKLGRWYNNAELVVEANNMGQSTIDRLVELNYPSIYKRKHHNKVTKKTTEEYGWWNDQKTRPMLLGYMQTLVRELGIDIPDETILDEMATFIVNERGKPEGAEGNNDDCVIATSLAYYGLKLNPYVPNVAKSNLIRAKKRASKFRQMRLGSRFRK